MIKFVAATSLFGCTSLFAAWLYAFFMNKFFGTGSMHDIMHFGDNYAFGSLAPSFAAIVSFSLAAIGIFLAVVGAIGYGLFSLFGKA